MVLSLLLFLVDERMLGVRWIFLCRMLGQAYRIYLFGEEL